MTTRPRFRDYARDLGIERAEVWTPLCPAKRWEPRRPACFRPPECSVPRAACLLRGRAGGAAVLNSRLPPRWTQDSWVQGEAVAPRGHEAPSGSGTPGAPSSPLSPGGTRELPSGSPLPSASIRPAGHLRGPLLTRSVRGSDLGALAEAPCPAGRRSWHSRKQTLPRLCHQHRRLADLPHGQTRLSAPRRC